MAKKIKGPVVEISAHDKASAVVNSFARRTKIALEPIEGLGRIAGSALKGIGVLAGAATAAGYAVERLLSGYTERVGELHNFARQTGFSVEALQEFRYAADLADVGVENFDRSLGVFMRTLGQAKTGTGPLLTWMKKAGAEGKALHGAMRGKGSEASLEAVITAMAKLEDPTKRAALAQAAFGRGGGKMVRLALEGSTGLARLREEARRFGLVSAEEAERAEEFGDAMTRMKYATTGLVNLLGGELIPALRPVIDGMSEWIVKNRAVIGQKIHKAVGMLSDGLDQVGIWFDEHGEEVWAGFLSGMDSALDLVRVIANNFDSILTVTEGIAAVWVGGKIAAAIKAMVAAAAPLLKLMSWLTVGAGATAGAVLVGATAGVAGGVAINAELARNQLAKEQTTKKLKGQVGAEGYAAAFERTLAGTFVEGAGLTARRYTGKELFETRGFGAISGRLNTELQNVAAEQMASKVREALRGVIKIAVDFHGVPPWTTISRPEAQGSGLDLEQTIERMPARAY